MDIQKARCERTMLTKGRWSNTRKFLVIGKAFNRSTTENLMLCCSFSLLSMTFSIELGFFSSKNLILTDRKQHKCCVIKWPVVGLTENCEGLSEELSNRICNLMNSQDTCTIANPFIDFPDDVTRCVFIVHHIEMEHPIWHYYKWHCMPMSRIPGGVMQWLATMQQTIKVIEPVMDVECGRTKNPWMTFSTAFIVHASNKIFAVDPKYTK